MLLANIGSDVEESRKCESNIFLKVSSAIFCVLTLLMGSQLIAVTISRVQSRV